MKNKTLNSKIIDNTYNINKIFSYLNIVNTYKRNKYK